MVGLVDRSGAAVASGAPVPAGADKGGGCTATPTPGASTGPEYDPDPSASTPTTTLAPSTAQTRQLRASPTCRVSAPSPPSTPSTPSSPSFSSPARGQGQGDQNIYKIWSEHKYLHELPFLMSCVCRSLGLNLLQLLHHLEMSRPCTRLLIKIRKNHISPETLLGLV